jgi:hypothetical protein
MEGLLEALLFIRLKGFFMHQNQTSRARCRPVITSYLASLIFACTFSAPVFVQAAEPAGTPDVIDLTELPQFPESAERTDLSEMEHNLILNAYNGDLAKVKVLVAKGANVNVQEQKKRTPLIFAATNGHTSVVEFLIGKGAEVNARDSGGQTALIYAAKRSFNETAAVLLKNGAEVNVQSKKKGITALMLAAVWDNEELVQMLLKHGADPQLTDTFGRTAKLLAEKKGNAAVVGLLSGPPVQESER